MLVTIRTETEGCITTAMSLQLVIIGWPCLPVGILVRQVDTCNIDQWPHVNFFLKHLNKSSHSYNKANFTNQMTTRTHQTAASPYRIAPYCYKVDIWRNDSQQSRPSSPNSPWTWWWWCSSNTSTDPKAYLWNQLSQQGVHNTSPLLSFSPSCSKQTPHCWLVLASFFWTGLWVSQ